MLARVALLTALQAVFCVGALARDLPPDLRGLFEGFQAHRRVAIGYLRTDNADLGAVEIERLRARWADDRRRLSAQRAADAALAAALARTEALVADSLKAADSGDVERSRQLLEAAAGPVDAWRRANDIRLFSDCVAELTATYEQVDRHRRQTPDLADPAVVKEISTSTEETIAALNRCDREAAEAVRREPEFRRLVDGMLASLRQTAGAVAARDNGLLHRLLDEQRSFERLLVFRYG